MFSKIVLPLLSPSYYNTRTEVALDLETMTLLLLRLAKVPKEEAIELAPALYWLRRFDKHLDTKKHRTKYRQENYPHLSGQQLRAKMEKRIDRICTLLDLTREELENAQ